MLPDGKFDGMFLQKTRALAQKLQHFPTSRVATAHAPNVPAGPNAPRLTIFNAAESQLRKMRRTDNVAIRPGRSSIHALCARKPQCIEEVHSESRIVAAEGHLVQVTFASGKTQVSGTLAPHSGV